VKILFFLLPLSFCISLNGQTKNPFLHLKFDKIVMYDFVGGKGSDLYIVNENGGLAKNIKGQVKLDKENVMKLNSKLGNKKSYGGGTAACFDPHAGFVYYLKDKVVAHVTICLDCNRLYSSIDIPAQKQGKVGKGKDIYYLSDGLSIPFRNFINQLLVANNFSHQI
jgi:hypothetical protein